MARLGARNKGSLGNKSAWAEPWPHKCLWLAILGYLQSIGLLGF